MKSLQFQKLVTLLGVVLFGIKLIAWRITGSNAIFSDTMESTVNIVAAFMGWYSLYLCAKPRDTDHPYGHGKVEFVTSRIEGILQYLYYFGKECFILFIHNATQGFSYYLVAYHNNVTSKENSNQRV